MLKRFSKLKRRQQQPQSTTPAVAAPASSSSTLTPSQKDQAKLNLQGLIAESNDPEPDKPPKPDTAKLTVDDGLTAIETVTAVVAPLKDLPDAIEKLHIDDALPAAQTAITLFNELADWTAVAGPFLKMGLGVISEIIKIAQEMQDNHDACIEFSKKVMHIFRGFALAAKVAGHPILTGTAEAVLLEDTLQHLRAFHAQVQVYQKLSGFHNFLKRTEIKTRLQGLNEEMKQVILILIAQNTIVLNIRSDFDLELQKIAQTAFEQRLASSSGSAMAGPQASTSSPALQPTSVQAVAEEGAATNTIVAQSSQISTATSSELLSIAQPGLDRVGAAVRTEIKRRSTLDGTGADVGSNQQTEATPAVRSVYPMTSEESAQLKQMQDQMRRLFSRGGDGADLTGIFDDDEEKTATGSDESKDDPGQAAVELLEVLCSTAASSGKETVSQLKRLCTALRDLGLFEEAVEVATLLTALCRRKVSDSGYPRDRANLGSALLNLSASFFLVGRWDEADATASEALGFFQKMARLEPKSYKSVLATALRMKAIHHARAGRRDEALECNQQSIDIYRSLRVGHLNLYRAALSGTLLNHTQYLSKMGKHAEALAAIEESVEMWRALHQARPAAYEADLALALNNYSNRLSEAGKHAEALAAIEESVKMYRALHQARPAAYEADLALALNNYSLRLREAGKHAEALAASEECVKMYRALHQARPAAYEADLARALNNYSTDLSDAGKRPEALAAIEECVKMYRALHQARPAAYEADLAGALNNYSLRLSEAGKHPEALTASEECVKMRRALHQARPAAYEADLASALQNYSNRLSKAGKHPEALAAIEECVKMYRAFHQARPAAYEADLARALRNYSIDLNGAGRHQDALQAIENSLALYQRLNQQRPDAFLQQFQGAEGTRDWIRSGG
ncbi:hypothetical protein OC846_005710 [Tilletia horrida]|uniref:Anaphase-promoting complex subunit 5 domain-containing protein n=1 Tax=Tilletia horrida TaxID=155126 RepID=A0AAN6GMV2_9BASI|nr:hypothetical protein OC846_005710 [Tilletia horrida]